jgi:thioesterase domain-containing protein
VGEAVVLAREDRLGDPRLVAYVVGSAPGDDLRAELREHLRGSLPEYMIPSAFVLLDSLPLTPNGKVDRKALPAPREGRQGQEIEYVPPQDAFELELVLLWEEILEIHPIGVRDTFFALGGHSLLAVRLVARITQRLGYELPLVELFQNPTIESLAQRLKGQSGALPPSLLVAFRASGHRQPFFCIHPGGGNLLHYLPLSRHLQPDRPFYGLQSWGLQEGATPDETIEAMAARYVAVIREAQPAGPYLLGGYSLGGIVAYEMALQLREEGEEIAFLGLFDSGVPRPPRSPAEDGGVQDPEPPLEPPPGEPLDPDALSRQGASLFRALPLHVRHLHHFGRIFAAHVRALQRYSPRAFDGRLTLYRAAEEEAGDDESLGWRSLALRGVTIREVPGNHGTLMNEPAVRELAARLAEDLP